MKPNGDKHWNKVWIIGASTGIGRELALAIAPKSTGVWISARNEIKLQEVASSVPNMFVIPLDITQSQQLVDAAQEIEQSEPSDSAIDLVVISSAVGLMSKLPRIDLEQYRQSIETNYMGTVNAISAVLPAMVACGRGHIALIASVAGYRGLPNGAPYAPTKAALISLAECSRPSLQRLGITVSVINPGFVETPMTAQNKFPMPFLMKSNEAARRIIRGLEKRQYEIAFPKRMVYLLKLLRFLPNNAFFLLADRWMLGKKQR
mgnify:CR=1 FL=1